METKQICAKALLNLVTEDTLPALIQVKPTPSLLCEVELFEVVYQGLK